MTPTTYTPEMRERDARIALAMGWTWIARKHPDRWRRSLVCKKQADHQLAHEKDYRLSNMTEEVSFGGTDTVPRFHADEIARRSLLEWLAADDERWWKFDNAFYTLHPLVYNEDGNANPDCCKMAFLATPDQVARAADAAIREGEK